MPTSSSFPVQPSCITWYKFQVIHIFYILEHLYHQPTWRMSLPLVTFFISQSTTNKNIRPVSKQHCYTSNLTKKCLKSLHCVKLHIQTLSKAPLVAWLSSLECHIPLEYPIKLDERSCLENFSKSMKFVTSDFWYSDYGLLNLSSHYQNLILTWSPPPKTCLMLPQHWLYGGLQSSKHATIKHLRA